MRAALAFARAASKNGATLRTQIITSAETAFADPAALRRAFEPLARAIMEGHAAKWCDHNEEAPASRFFRHWDSIMKAAAYDTGAKGDDRRAIVNPMIALLKRVSHTLGGSPVKAKNADAPKAKGGAVPNNSALTAEGENAAEGNAAEGAGRVAFKRGIAAILAAIRILENLSPRTAGDKRDIDNTLSGLRELAKNAA